MGPVATVLAASAAASVGLLGASAVAAVGLRSRSAASRHLAWTAGVTSALAFPALLGLSEAVPFLRLDLPAALAALTPGGVLAALAPDAALAALAPGGALAAFAPDAALAALAPGGALAALAPGGALAALAPGGALAPDAALPRLAAWFADGRAGDALLIAWAVGSALAAVRLLRGHLAAWTLVRAASPAPVASWAAPLQAAHRSLGMTRPVDLRRSPHLGSPLTVGVLRPRILLPAAATDWPEDRLHSVLLHELAHVRRHDALVQLLAGLATAAYWWNPLAWLAARRLRSEREDACDDVVLAAGVRPSAYATDLLAVARAILTPAPLGAVPAAGCTGTEARLRRILDPAVPRGAPSPALRLLVGVGAGALTTLAACARLTHPLETADAAVPAATSAALPAATSAALPAATSAALPARNAEALPTANAEALPAVGAPVEAEEDEPVVVRADARLIAAARPGLGDIDACFAATPAGRITMHWTVDAVGTTVEACVTEDTTGNDAVRQCVNEHLANGYFPGLADRSVEMSFPLHGV